MQTDGYIKGRPKDLTVLDYGLFKVHANGRIIGISGFLIRTDLDEAILVDTGFPAKYARNVAASSAQDRLGEFGEVLALTPDNLPAAQLARVGVTPGDIDLLIMTHTHIDHVGGIANFPRAPIVIGAPERRLPRPLYWGDVQPIEWPDREYLQIEGDVDLGPDLHLLFSPGHAPGQLSVLLRLPQTGPVLLTGDAISRPAEIDEGFAGTRDAETARKSAARLMEVAQETDAFVIYGHWPEQWPQLRKAPDFYD